jgi:chromosome segregation ATPase
MMEKTVQFIQKESTALGPIFLLCAITLSLKTGIPYDLLILAVGGFFLSSKLGSRGLGFALSLLGALSAFRHLFLVTDHLWALGVEGALAMSFFITALSSEEDSFWIQTLESQIETRKASLANLEEEIARLQKETADERIVFQEKGSTLQKELEDLQAEHSSILILNEVLRKNMARSLQEASRFEEAIYALRIEKDEWQKELCDVSAELSRLKNEDGLVLQNQELQNELNQARFAAEETHLINETLARLYARESLKAKDAEQEATSLKSMLQAAHQEIRRIEEPLKVELAAAKRKVDALNFEFEKTSKEANRARAELLKFHEVSSERNFLKERLESAMLELSTQSGKVDPELMEKLKFAEEKVFELSKIEPLYRQLKQQFEEKNHILHEARSSLFKVETELQRLKIEKAALELQPLPKEVERELQGLTEEIARLEEENRELEELVSHLSLDSAESRKKKVKIKQSSLEQPFLF